MNAIDKNKEEIEKMLEEFNGMCSFRGKIRERSAGVDYTEWNKLKSQLESTIKTSILWCEDEIEFLNKLEFELDSIWRTKEYNGRDYGLIKVKLEQHQTHLTWLKEQEIKNDI